MTELHPDGPHSPGYTREVANTLAQAARVLAHATRGSDGLVNPADAYDLASTLIAACRSLSQTLTQTVSFLDVAAEYGMLADATESDADEVARRGAERFSHARDAVDNLETRLDKAQQTISGLATKPEGSR